jgi:hypothetical protein
MVLKDITQGVSPLVYVCHQVLLTWSSPLDFPGLEMRREWENTGFYWRKLMETGNLDDQERNWRITVA